MDLNGDGKPDFVALIAQGQESVVAFLNKGDGKFESRTLWAAPHPVWGFSGLTAADLNGDGKIDFVITHGDTVDDGVHFKPYQGVSWLENKGKLQFEYHSIGQYYGAYAPKAVDVDGDGDLDVIASSFLPGADQMNQRKMQVPGMFGTNRFLRACSMRIRFRMRSATIRRSKPGIFMETETWP